MMAMAALLSVSVLLCVVWTGVDSFNLDYRLPLLKYGPNGSYFGYSVAQHVTSVRGTFVNQIPRVLVGAPKLEGTGAVFDCPLTTYKTDCEKLDVESPSGTDDEIRQDQWLGVTVRSQGPGGYAMACAHRYVRAKPNARWGLGVCYSLTNSLDSDNVWMPCDGRSVAKAHEEFGYCQSGTSGVITEDNNILFGSPGPYTWRGTIFSNIVTFGMRDDKQWYLGPLESNSPVEKYSYLGMAVTSGRFFRNEMSFVAGAPRSNGTGQVVFFKKNPGNPTLEVQLALSGDVFASSFGYEVQTSDVDGNGRVDLIVGAPFYYGKDAGGAIYVYLNKDEGLTEHTVPTIISGPPDSRFGLAIANLKDLNRDKYEDIAVGAPYDGTGAVYVYLGSKDGIQTKPSQIIRSSDLVGLPISTFGYSLAGGIDMDGNGYPDLVIGAYDADKAIMLRARPIIDIETRVSGNLSNIDPLGQGCYEDPRSGQVCFGIKACFKLTHPDRRSMRDLRLEYRIIAETFSGGKKFSRVTFRNGNPDAKHIIQKLLTLTSSAWTDFNCALEVVYVKENTRDILNPVAFQLSYQLVPTPPKPTQDGDPLPDINQFPILNQKEASKTFQATFAKDCGDNDICESDLHVEAKLNLPKGELELGKMREVILDLNVSNNGESAYEAAAYVSYPSSLSFIGAVSEGNLYSCIPHPNNKSIVQCTLGNPFKRMPYKQPAHIQLRFNPSGVQDREKKLRLVVTANSTSEELTPQEEVILVAKVVRKADLELIGTSSQEQVFYGGEVRGESAIKFEDEVGSPVEHVYQVLNRGPWKVGTLRVNVHWPYEVENGKKHGKWLLYMVGTPQVDGNGECYMEPGQVNPLNLTRRLIPQSRRITDYDVPPDSPVTDPDETPPTEPSSTATSSSDRSSKSSTSRKRTKTTSKSSTVIRNGETVESTHNEFREEEEEHEEEEERSNQRNGAKRRSKREYIIKPESVEKDGKIQSVVAMNCQLGTAKCFTFGCEIRQLDANKTAVIRIRARLWNSTFVEDYPDVDYVEIRSNAKIELDPGLGIEQDESNDEAYAETIAYPDIQISQKPQEVPWWVYLIAILCGLLLLVLLVLCLWKLGFFKRKKPSPEMKAQLEKNDNYYSDNPYHD